MEGLVIGLDLNDDYSDSISSAAADEQSPGQFLQ